MLEMDFNIEGERVRVIGVHLRSRLEEENKDMGDDGVFIDTSDIPDFSSIFEEQTAKQS